MMKKRRRNHIKPSYKQTLCEDLLLQGHVQSFIEFFSITHHQNGRFPPCSSLFRNDDDDNIVLVSKGDEEGDDVDEDCCSSHRRINDDVQPSLHSSYSVRGEKEHEYSYCIDKNHHQPLSSNNNDNKKKVNERNSNDATKKKNMTKKDMDSATAYENGEEKGKVLVVRKRDKGIMRKDVTFCTEVSFQDGGGEDGEEENSFGSRRRRQEMLLGEDNSDNLKRYDDRDYDDTNNQCNNNDVKKESFAKNNNGNIAKRRNDKKDVLSFIRSKLVEAECAQYENNDKVCIDSYSTLANFFETRQQPQECSCQQLQKKQPHLQLRQQKHSRQHHGGSAATASNLKRSFYFYLKCLDVHKQNNDVNGQMESYHHLGRLLTKIAMKNKCNDVSTKESINDINCSDDICYNDCLQLKDTKEKKQNNEQWYKYSICAIRYHESHMILARKVNDSREKQRAGEKLVNAYLNHARQIIDPCCNHHHCYDDDENMGEKDYKKKKKEEALLFYLKSIESARAMEDKNTECNACQEIGEVYISLGQYKKGKKYKRLHKHLHHMLSSQRKKEEKKEEEEYKWHVKLLET